MNSFPNWRATVSDNAYRGMIAIGFCILRLFSEHSNRGSGDCGVAGMDDAAESVESVESFRE